jgi:hypothetical protein
MLKPSTLKSRRRRVPHFDDEPIQWHRNSTKHDKCPWCGIQDMTYFSKTSRSCGKCHVDVCIDEEFKSGKAWYDYKLNGGEALNSGNPGFSIFVPEGEEPYELLTAQKMSHNGRARLHVKFGFDETTIYWHREGHVPEDKEGNRIVAAGSDYWYWLMNRRLKKIWVPDDVLNAMEVLARAATDDPVFAIMLG